MSFSAIGQHETSCNLEGLWVPHPELQFCNWSFPRAWIVKGLLHPTVTVTPVKSGSLSRRECTHTHTYRHTHTHTDTHTHTNTHTHTCMHTQLVVFYLPDFSYQAKFLLSPASPPLPLSWILLISTTNASRQRWSFIPLSSLKIDRFWYILDIFRSLLLLSATQILKVLERAVHWMLLNLWNESVDMTSDQQNFSSQFHRIWQLIITTILILFDVKLTTLYHRWIGKVSNLHIS